MVLISFYFQSRLDWDDDPQSLLLFGGFKHFLFSIIYYIWDVILPIDELIFFKMVIAPPTSSGISGLPSGNLTLLLKITIFNR